MADKIRGITIELSGDTSKLTASLKDVNSSISSTSKQLKDVERLLKLDPSNTELLRQKQQLLAKQVEETKNKVEELNRIQDEMDAQGVDENSEQYQALQREIISTEERLKSLEEETKNFGSVGAQQVAQVGEKLKDVGEKMESTGKSLSSTVTAPIAAGFTAAVKTTMDFDSAMSNVAATMGTTTDQIGNLRDFAREMGATTAFSASEAAEAMNYMALAGYDTEEIMQMLPTVLDLAAAGEIDLADASDMVTDAQSALGLSAQETVEMVDQMAAASSHSNTSVSQLGEAILKIGATARNVKGGTQELATVLGVLADNGIKGSEGGTHLRNILLSLQESAENGAVKFGDFSVQIYDTEGNMRSLVDIVGDMQNGLSGMTQASKDAIISGVFNKTDLAAVNALLGTSSERFMELGAAISNSAGAASDMAATKLDNLKGQLTLLKSALQELAISIGDIIMPVVREIVAKIQEWVDKFNALDDGTKKIIVIIALVVAALGPLLIILGKVFSGIGAILTTVPKIVSGIKMIGTAITGLLDMLMLNPEFLLFTAIAVAVIALVVLIVKNIDVIKAALAEAGQWITNFFASIGQAITNAVQAVVNFIVNAVQAAFRLLQMLGAAAASFGAGGLGGSTTKGLKGMATGGTISSGSALIGENGPELLTMVGSRAQITPLTDRQRGTALSAVSGAAGGDVKVNVNFTGSLSQLARILQPEIQVETARRGTQLIKA